MQLLWQPLSHNPLIFLQGRCCEWLLCCLLCRIYMMVILQRIDLVFASGGSNFSFSPSDSPYRCWITHRHITQRFVYSDKHNFVPGNNFPIPQPEKHCDFCGSSFTNQMQVKDTCAVLVQWTKCSFTVALVSQLSCNMTCSVSCAVCSQGVTLNVS